MTINASDFKSALDNADTLRARNASLRADVAQLEQRIGQMRKTIDRLKAVGARLVQERETARAMADEARTGVDNLRGQLQLADASNASLSAWNAELDGAARNAAVALADIIEKAEAMLAENTRLRAALEVATKGLAPVELRALAASMDVAALRAENTRLSGDLAAARRERDELRVIYERAADRAAKADDENTPLREALRTAAAAFAAIVADTPDCAALVSRPSPEVVACTRHAECRTARVARQARDAALAAVTGTTSDSAPFCNLCTPVLVVHSDACPAVEPCAGCGTTVTAKAGGQRVYVHRGGCSKLTPMPPREVET